MARKIWQQASADPTASPSGRACEVNTNRSCSPIWRSTSSSKSLCLFSTGFLARLVSLLGARQQFLDSSFFLFRTVQPKIQLGGASQVQALHQFMTDIFARRFQTLQAFVRIRVIAFHVDPNLRRPAIVRDMHRGHAYQSNAGIGECAFDERFNLLAQCLANPPAMVFQPALLHATAPQVKRMRISEKWAPVCDPEALLSRALMPCCEVQ